MTYYGIKSHDTGEKVFAVIAITLFVIWLINPSLLGDNFLEDKDPTQSKKNLNKKDCYAFNFYIIRNFVYSI